MDGLIYYEKLNTLTRKYFIKGVNTDASTFNSEYNNTITELAELLMYYNGISFYVYGENIPMAVLINVFGVKGLESLLEQGAINFLFCKPEVMYNVDEIPGLLPLQSAEFSSKPHSDPEESAVSGFNWLSNPLHEKQKRRLLKKILDAYHIPPKSISKNSVKFGIDGYNKNMFSNFGLPKQKDIDKLNKYEREKLCSLANECNTLAILSEFHYYSLDSFRVSQMNNMEMNALQSANKIRHATNSLFSIENLPNFETMLNKKIITCKEIPKLRSSKNSIRFRDWIDQATKNEDGIDITHEYLDSIENTKGILEKEPGKILKTIGISAASCLIGGLVTGSIEGVCAGGILSKIIEPSFDFGISMLDGYVLDGILKGWNPRHYFAKDISSIINEKHTM